MKALPYDLYIRMEELKNLWPEETCRNTRILTCGFISLELSFRLLATELKKRRGIERQRAIICGLLGGIENQFKLLNGFKYAQAFEQGINMEESSCYSRNISCLNRLDSRYSDIVDRITKEYFRLAGKVGVDLGLGAQMNNIRAAFCMPPINYFFRKKLAYCDLINLTEMNGLENDQYFNSEDEIFMTVHQISECWFKLAIEELNEAYIEIKESDASSKYCSKHLQNAAKIIHYLGEHIMILENMELVDYHPLRVALRGASGGQSQQAYKLFMVAKKVFRSFLGIVEEKQTNLLEIMEKPEAYRHFDSLIYGFSQLERSLKNFFFQHYILSSSIIGSQSFGSIGKDLIMLTKKFTEPIFKEIDEAKYAFTLKTNFQYGEVAGKLILEKEYFQPLKERDEVIDSDIIESTVDQYFHAIRHLDSENWVKLFESKGYIEDPKGSRPYIGHKELDVFFKGVTRTFQRLDMNIKKTEIYENSAHVYWKAKAIAFNDKELAFEGKEIFHISPEGKILAAEVEWNPEVVALQL